MEAERDIASPQKEGLGCAACRILPCDEASLDAAAELLSLGGVAVVPTDTVYGLAAHPSFPDAVARLYSIKGRESGKKIALLASGADAVEKFGFSLSPAAKNIND